MTIAKNIILDLQIDFAHSIMSLPSAVRYAASYSLRRASRCRPQSLVFIQQSSLASSVISQSHTGIFTSRVRFYASKSKVKSTADLVPGSKQALTSEAARLEYGKAEAKMSAAVEWYRKEVAGLETRASGRVTPALLSPVRIELPGKGKDLAKLEDIATVGVRDGSTLIISVFEEHVSPPTPLTRREPLVRFLLNAPVEFESGGAGLVCRKTTEYHSSKARLKDDQDSHP